VKLLLDYQTLMLPVLKRAAQGETRVPEIEEKIAAEFNLTPDERNQMLPSGRQKVLHNPMASAGVWFRTAGDRNGSLGTFQCRYHHL
jgi:restriction system protein